jgi:hypothetical protein
MAGKTSAEKGNKEWFHVKPSKWLQAMCVQLSDTD